MMLPPWNKIEWGLPIEGRSIAFRVDGQTYLRYHDGNGFRRTANPWIEIHGVEEWRYLDDVHTK